MSADDPLVSTKERPGIYDGYESLKPGEPFFPVQGGDPLGPATVLFWAREARQRGLEEPNEATAKKLLRKASAAEEVAWAMRAYQRGEQEIAGRRASYNDQDDKQDETKSDRAVRIRAAEALQDAIGRVADVAETLAKARLLPEQEVRVREAMELLRAAAFEVEPRRGQERT